MCVAEPDVELPLRPSFQRNDIDVYVCASCGTYVCDAPYDADQYNESYYTIAAQDRASLESRWGFRWRYVLDRIRKQAPESSSILDVGAGNGLFVKLAAEEFDLRATGIEISRPSVEFAQATLGVDLIEEDLNEHLGTYDVVTAFSVIEHVADPRAMVRSLAQHTEPGGLVVVATPSPASIQRRVRGERRWGMICPPHHLNIFTRRGLEQLLAEEGLEVLDWEAISTSVKAVRRIDTDSELLRRSIFQALRATSLGADQLVFARKTG